MYLKFFLFGRQALSKKVSDPMKIILYKAIKRFIEKDVTIKDFPQEYEQMIMPMFGF